jgi:hypothetical protein
VKQGSAKNDLGPLPWNTEVLRKAYFRGPFDIRKAIQVHPGYRFHADLLNLGSSLDIFKDSVADLFKSVATFNSESQVNKFWTRSMRQHFDVRLLAVQRGVFSVATTAMALVDHSRVVNQRIKIPSYQKQVDKYFLTNEEHQFIQGLRQCISHCRVVEAEWEQSWTKTKRHTRFLLHIEKLLAYSNWRPLAKVYMNKHIKGIDLEVLVKKYQACVYEFHSWFHSEIKKMVEPELSEYREYERKINSFASKAEWSMLLKQVVLARGMDPYLYLDRYLSDSELTEVLSLPMRSQKQVDKIIEVVDSYNVCDDELRNVAYRAFGVNAVV